MRALSGSFAGGCALRHLNVSNSYICLQGARELGRRLLTGARSLESLNLSGCLIPEAGAKYLAMGLEDAEIALTSPDISGNPTMADGVTALLDAMQTCRLEEVNVSSCKICDAGAPALIRLVGRARRLRMLNAEQSGITDQWLNVIGATMLATMRAANRS